MPRSMSTVRDVETVIAKMSPAEILEIADWLENFLEDQRQIRPEFLARIRRGQEDIATGRVEIVKS